METPQSAHDRLANAKKAPNGRHAMLKFVALERRDGEEWAPIRFAVDGKRRIWAPVAAFGSESVEDYAARAFGAGVFRWFTSPRPSRDRAVAGAVFEIHAAEAEPEPDPDEGSDAADDAAELRAQLAAMRQQNDQMSLGHWERMRELSQNDANLLVGQLGQMYSAQLAHTRSQMDIELETLRARNDRDRQDQQAREDQDRARTAEHFRLISELKESQTAPLVEELRGQLADLRGELDELGERAEKDAEERETALATIAQAQAAPPPDFSQALLQKVAEDPSGAMSALKQVLQAITGSPEAPPGGTLTE